MKYRTYIYICTTLLEIPAWLEPTVLKPGKHYEGTICSRKIFDEIIVDRAQTAVTTKTVYFPPPLNVCTVYIHSIPLCISFFGQFVTLDWRIHGQITNISMSRKVRESRISVARLLSSRIERYTQVCREDKRKSKLQVPCTLSYKL